MTYTPTEQANLDIVRRLYVAENAHDADGYGAFFADSAEIWGNGQLVRAGREAQVEHIRVDTFTPFPDWHNETLSLFADGDAVVARWRCTGTHAAPGHHADGRRLELNGTTTFELRDGLVHFFRYDMDTAPLPRLFAQT